MTTAKELIYDAFYELKIKQEGVPIEPSEAQVGIRYLNNLMTAWDAMGISLGFTLVTKLSDPVTVPLGANLGILGQLAINLANPFNAEVTPALAKKAKDGFKAILNLTSLTKSQQYPSTLPTGSGNYNGDTCNTFYPSSQRAILGETGGNVATEDDTEES